MWGNKHLAENPEEIKNLKSEIAELNSQIKQLVSIQKNIQTKSQSSKRQDKSLFWFGAILGLLGGTISGFGTSFYMKLLDFQPVSFYNIIIITIGFYCVYGLLIWVMWTLAKEKRSHDR
jgi:hypothetical protein